MSDVTIPAETARAIAAWLRTGVVDADAVLFTSDVAAWADALDPRPSLRDAVARAMAGVFGGFSKSPEHDYADVALAVVRDHIAALRNPWHVGAAAVSHNAYKGALRDVLALLDGAES